MSKRVLLVLGDYYPNPSANGICIKKIVDVFKDQGYVVECVISNTTGIKNDLVLEGVKLHFVKTPVVWRLYYCANEQNNIIKKILLIARKIVIYLRLPFLTFSYPAESKSYRDRVVKKIHEAISKNTFDAVIGVNKPAEAIWGAYEALKDKNIPFISYFLDPFVGGIKRNRILGEDNSFKKLQAIEKAIVDYSSACVFMKEHKESFKGRYGEEYLDKTFFLGVPLLENNMAENSSRISKKEKTVIYAGAVYKDIRNPAYIMEVFKHITNVKLIMYISNPNDWIADYSNSNVEIRGRIPHDQVIKEMRRADALLNIGNSDSIFAPSKIIECIGFGKPIISTYRVDGDSSVHYLKDYPCAAVIDERNVDVKDAASMIQNILQNDNSQLINYNYLKKIYSENDPEVFVNIINKILNKK